MTLTYIIRCLANGKLYVGITSRTFEARWGNHIRDARLGSSYLFHRAIRKYGSDAFERVALFVWDTPEAGKAWERACIAALKTKAPYGYNRTDGGDGSAGAEVSAETRQKMSVAKKGKLLSAETRRKMSEIRKGKIQTEATKQKRRLSCMGQHLGPLSEEHKRKLREARKNRVFTSEDRARISVGVTASWKRRKEAQNAP